MSTKYVGDFEQMVLLSLMRLGANAYGMTIRREISERAEREVSIGAVYTTLDRLERRGLISSREGSPTPERGGRAKRFFRIEAPGVKALQESRETMLRMWDGLPQKA
jgi:PadR family transcriptional regulator PadR